MVEEAILLLPTAVLEHAERADVVVADVPGGDALDLDDVPLAHYERTPRGRRDRLTVFRRPIESRATTREELAEVVRIAMAEEIADTLGIDLGEDWDHPDD